MVAVVSAVAVVFLASCGSATLPAAEVQPTGKDGSTQVSLDDPIGSESPPTSLAPDATDDRAGEELAAETTTADSWTDVTSNLVGVESTCGNVSLISSHPDRDQVIAGIASHGLWTLDATTGQWSPLGDGPGSAEITNRTTSIEYDPDDPDRFWESGAYGAGAFRTDDGGVTFQGLGDLRHLDSISVQMEDPSRQVMVSGTHEQRAVYRSTDGGESWIDVASGLPADAGNTAYALVLDEETYLVGSYGGDGAGIFRTTDAGESWSRVHQGAVRGLPVLNEDKILWLVDGGGGVVLSTDGGATFELSGGRFAGAATNLDVLPDGRLITVGDRSIVVSDDDGRRWRPLGPPLPFEPRGVAVAERRSAIYIWQHTCFFGEVNPVIPQSIMELDFRIGEGSSQNGS